MDLTLAELAARATALRAARGRRVLIGIVGAPGAGKSWTSERLAEALGASAVVVPMDGFHLAQVELERLGRADRKGAPDTFDVGGLAALLRRIREEADAVVYAPAFVRAIEEPIAGAIPVPPDAGIVLVEGNYLHLDAWAAVGACLDEVWFLEVPDGLRADRLHARHESFGRTPEAARDWVASVDEPNAVSIAAQRGRADLVVRLLP